MADGIEWYDTPPVKVEFVKDCVKNFMSRNASLKQSELTEQDTYVSTILDVVHELAIAPHCTHR